MSIAGSEARSVGWADGTGREVGAAGLGLGCEVVVMVVRSSVDEVVAREGMVE